MTFHAFGQSQNLPENMDEFLTAFRCGGCHRGYFAHIFKTDHKSADPCSYSGDIDHTNKFVIDDEYPVYQGLEMPEYLPENILNFYKQAAETHRSGLPDASAMMSRKVLEVSTKKLNPEGSGSLFKRIEQLHDQGVITSDIKNWAHIIRDNGNNAAHEETPVTAQDALELLSFVEMFLMYTFTMPQMVNNKKQANL